MKKSKFSLSLSTIAIVLALSLVSCGEENSETKVNLDNVPSGVGDKILWNDDSSLGSLVVKTLGTKCNYFPQSNVSVELKAYIEDQSMKIFAVNDAEMFLFRDGALEPSIEDEISTKLYYEEWKCSEDTLFIEELRSPDNSITSAKDGVFVSECGYGYSTKPTTIVLTCADGGIRIEDITWRSWNSSEASGSGLLIENTCEPDCASGNYNKQSAKVILGSVKSDSKGTLVFSEISVETQNKQVSGAYLDTFELEHD
jgi:hypothetical protein